MMHPVRMLEVSAEQRAELEAIMARPSAHAGVVRRDRVGVGVPLDTLPSAATSSWRITMSRAAGELSGELGDL